MMDPKMTLMLWAVLGQIAKAGEGRGEGLVMPAGWADGGILFQKGYANWQADHPLPDGTSQRLWWITAEGYAALVLWNRRMDRLVGQMARQMAEEKKR